MYDYIYLKHEDGIFYAPAAMAEFNFAPCKGEIFCKFNAEIEFGQLNGKTLTQAGLTKGKSMASTAAASAVSYKKGADKLLVTLTLTLKQEGDFCFLAQPNGADNDLCRDVLSGEIDLGKFELGLAEDFLPFDALHFNESKLKQKQPAAATQEGQVLSVSSGAFSLPVKEVVLFYKAKPSLRTVLKLSKTLKLCTLTAPTAVSVQLPQSYVSEIFDVAVDYVQTPNYTVLPCTDSLSFLAESSYKIGPDTTIKTGAGNRVLLIDSHGVMLTDGLKPHKWFAASDAKITSNGAVVIFSDTVSVEDEAGSHKLNIKSGSKNEAVFSDGVYLIACLNGGHLTLSRVNPLNDYEVSTLVERNVGDAALVDFFGCYVACLGDFNCCYSAVGTNSTITNWLNSISPHLSPSKKPFFDEGRLTFFEQERTYYIDYLQSTRHNCAGFTYNDFLVQYIGQKTYILRLGDNAELLEFSCRIKAWARSGNRFYVITDDGRLLTYLVGSKNVRLVCKSIRQLSNLSYYARCENPLSGSVRLKLDIKY